MVSEERHDTVMPLRCDDCGTEWDEHFSLPMNVEVFAKKGKAIACPNCGGKKILMLPSGDFYVPDKKDDLALKTGKSGWTKVTKGTFRIDTLDPFSVLWYKKRWRSPKLVALNNPYPGISQFSIPAFFPAGSFFKITLQKRE